MRSEIIILIGSIVALLLSGCTTTNKSIAAGGSTDAFSITTYDPKTGGTAPEMIAGGGCFAYASTKAYSQWEKATTTIVFSQRTSLWDLFNSGSTNKVFIYVAGTDEDSEATLKMIEKLKGLLVK